MKMKRYAHHNIIKEHQRQLQSNLKKSHNNDHPIDDNSNNQQEVTISEIQQKQFYMSMKPNDDSTERGYSLIDFSRKKGSGGGNLRLDDLILDLNGDDNESMNKNKLIKKWDKKKRKYILTNPNAKNDWLMNKKNEIVNTESNDPVASGGLWVWGQVFDAPNDEPQLATRPRQHLLEFDVVWPN